jgi:hypothetical protein
MPSIHLWEQQLLAFPEILFCFIMHHFISCEGLYHRPSHMAEYVDLCDWAGTGQDKLCIVYDHFEHYLKS